MGIHGLKKIIAIGVLVAFVWTGLAWANGTGTGQTGQLGQTTEAQKTTRPEADQKGVVLFTKGQFLFCNQNVQGLSTLRQYDSQNAKWLMKSQPSPGKLNGPENVNMQGIKVHDFMNQFIADGYSSKEASEMVAYIQGLGGFEFVDNNGNVIQSIYHVATMVSDDGTIGKMLFTGHKHADGSYLNVAQIGDTFYAGKGLELYDIKTLLTTKPDLARNILDGGAGTFAAGLIVIMGSVLKARDELQGVPPEILDRLNFDVSKIPTQGFDVVGEANGTLRLVPRR